MQVQKIIQNRKDKFKMRTVTKEFKVYSYEELSEKAKERVKENYIENNIDPEDFTDDLIEDLKALGLNNLRPYYSLDYCQGDGVCLHGHIEFDEINEELRDIFYKGFLLSDYKLIKELKEYSRIEFNHVGRHFNYNSVEIDIYIDGSLNSKKYKQTQKLTDKLIKNWYVRICKEYEQWGYEYFYDFKDEDLKDFYDSNEYEFLEDGTLFN